MCRQIGTAILAAVLLGIPTVLPADGANEPTWKTEFRKAYGLKDGELVRRVAPPYPACRVEYFRDQGDCADHFTKFGWKEGWTVDDLLMQRVPVKPDVGATLGQVIHMTTGFKTTRMDAWAVVLARKVTGDFVVQADADPQEVATALEKILRKECDLAISLDVQEDEREVYVMSGKYFPKPLAKRKKNRIEVYANELTNPEKGGGGSGSLQEMAGVIEDFIDVPLAIGEVTGAPKQVEWHFNYRSPVTDLERAQDRDAELVMENIAAQTGLTVEREKRKIKVLVVKEAK